MKISTKGRYGIKALIDLVMNSENESVTLKTISKRQNISERYLEQIFSALRKSGIIIGRKGAQGGYTLAKDPKEITISEILRVLEYFKSITLQDLVDKYQLSKEGIIYYI